MRSQNGGRFSVTCNREALSQKLWLIRSLLLGLCLLQGCSGYWDKGRWPLDIDTVSFQHCQWLTSMTIPSSRIPKQEKAVSARTTIFTRVRRALEMLSETISLWSQNQDLKGPKHYSSLHPSLFLPLPKLNPFLDCDGPQSLPGVPRALP